MKVRPARAFRGTFRLPGDKSITHRAFMFGAISPGLTTVEGASSGADCLSTRRCLASLGVRFEDDAATGRILVHGGEPFASPAHSLDCGNSGTTLRLLMGLLAGRPLEVTLDGDASLQQRPMERVANPLRRMGARIETTAGRPPVRVTGSALRGASVTPEAASAQIKSAVLLAALRAEGTTRLTETIASRDHTERMIGAFGGIIGREGNTLRIDGPQTLSATAVSIPGDPSSAAPFIVAALLLRDSEVVIEDVLLNPHRTRYLEVLRDMGANIEVELQASPSGEPAGRIVARTSALRGLTLSPQDVPAVVDELPILAVAGAFGAGRFEVRGAEELRVKESDRITSMTEGLRAMGARIEERRDGFIIEGGQGLSGASLSSHGDHRIAMALSVAALGARGDSTLEGGEAVLISLPGFFAELERGAGR